MRVLIALSSFLLGASLADNLINKLIPDVDFDNMDCSGDACFLRNQLLSVDRTKTDPSTGMAYNERSLAYASTQNLLPICLPNVAREAVADSFTSCEGKKMEDICVFTKRGWLVKDAQEESVANLEFLKTAFSGLAGGDEAVNYCLKIKEEAEADDYSYEYYDYADYYDEYDYLEEGVERRVRREAGKDKGKKGGKGKKKNGGGGAGRKAKNDDKKKKNGNKGPNSRKNKPNRKNGKGKPKKKGGKGGRKANKKDSKKKNGSNKPKSRKNKPNKKNGEGNSKPTGRKFVKKPSKKPSEENVKQNLAKIDARLNKLGLSKLPVKSTLDGLECMWNELEDLLIKCGEKAISNSP